MNLIFRNLIRTSIVVMLVLSYTYLNPQTAEWHDVLRIALQAAHNPVSQSSFGFIWLLLCAIDLVISGPVISLPARGSVSHSHSVSYVERRED
jgi:hypothetical protein